MLVFHFIFAIAASYYLCVSGDVSVECFDELQETCDYSVFPEDVPTTVDQLRGLCRDIKELGACILKGIEGCSLNDDSNYTEKFRKIMGYIHGVCREDSEIFQVISNNLECIASTSENAFESCRMLDYTDATKALIMDTVRQFAEKADNGPYEPHCIDSLWNAYCLSIKAGVRCGFEAGSAVKDILLNIDDSPMCSEKFKAEITPMLEVIEIAVIQEEVLMKMKEEEEDDEESQAEEVRRKRRFASPFQPFIDFQ